MGFVHSIEMGSFVDGPGVRFVVFLSGCPLRCRYCHNPDAWSCHADQRTEAAEILAKIERAAPFLKSAGGGVTVSGGEPLAQPEFTHEILQGAQALGLHTALDTSGFLSDRVTEEMLGVIDLVLLDIKSINESRYQELTGVELEPTLAFAERLSAICKPMWVRFVLVPGVTDDPEDIAGLARFIGRLSNVERVEVLPFHQMAEHKWTELGFEYSLRDTPPPSAEQVQAAVDLFAAEGISVGRGRFVPCMPSDEKGDPDAEDTHRPG
jgi:pyruvate formate lyase activating enzyme